MALRPDLLWAGFLWLLYKGYLLAFGLGVITALHIGIVKNARQIRRNSEAIRRKLEQR